jgi:hypothetical protein
MVEGNGDCEALGSGTLAQAQAQARQPHQEKHHEKHHTPKILVDAPFSIGGLFGSDGDDDDLEQNYEVSAVSFSALLPPLQIRQFAWHEANANRVWPGTFVLSNFLTMGDPELLARLQHAGTTCLELGAATGALSIHLSSPPWNIKIHTSDIADDGTVEANILHNFQLNTHNKPRQHIAHTWGTPWSESCDRAGLTGTCFNFILASDILLYVSVYPALVQTLLEVFASNPGAEFIMSWNRRMDVSKQFFALMKEAGFSVIQSGCIYTFSL